MRVPAQTWTRWLLLLGLAGCAETAPLGVLGLGECQFAGRGGLCTNGPCSIVVPVGAVRDVVSVELRVEEAPPGLREETAGNLVCSVGPADLRFDLPAELRIDYSQRTLPDGLELEDLSGFEILPSGAPAPVLEARAEPEFSRVVLPIDGATRAAATFVPVDIDLVDVLGKVPFDVSDVPSYLRTVSSFEFDAGFYDGRRLYLGNGPRLLIWNEGVPEDATRPPDVVLGRRDLVTVDVTPSAADFSGAVRAIWSDGNRLVVAEGNRVLIWNRVPRQSHVPADLVLGQEDFDGTAPNAGGAPSAATLHGPSAIASDGQRLLVADTSNHRTLVWSSFPRLLGQPADLVVGQETFEDNRIRGGALSLYQPRGVYFDGRRALFTSSFGCSCALGIDGPPGTDNPAPDFEVGEDAPTRVTATNFTQPSALSPFGAGGLALRDRVGSRVSLWRGFPGRADQVPDLLVGKPDFTVGGTGITPISASSLAFDRNGAIDAGRGVLVVPDQRRVLVWRSPPEHHFAPADLVIGQPGPSTALAGVDYRNAGRTTLAQPSGLSVAGRRWAVADEGNSRVLLFERGASEAPRVTVLGQSDGAGFLPNRGRAEAGADTMKSPRGVFTDGNRVVVADTQNHRVLVWNTWPSQDGAPADRVLGQADFRSNAPNHGGFDGDRDGWPDASARSLFYPHGVLVHAGTLYVSDSFNHRVLGFVSTGDSDRPARVVFGQPDFRSYRPNRGRGWFVRSGDGFAMPMGLAVGPGGRLWVADRENNRVMAVSLPEGRAAIVLGQPDARADVTPNFSAVDGSSPGFPVPESSYEARATTMRRPEGVAFHGERLVVADTLNHRVLVFEPPFADGAEAAVALGQDDLQKRAANADGVTARSMSGPVAVASSDEGVLVADRANHRLLGFAASALRPGGGDAATAVFGQLDFGANGINQSAASPGLLARPTGVAWDGERLWVADREQHRVIAYGDDGEPAFVFGQSRLDAASENAGRSPGADTLSAPTDVFANGEVVLVADRGNHRVLMWRGGEVVTGRPADVVIGQADFQSADANRGRGLDGADADGLRSPEGVFYDGTSLFVADTGNNRVLVFREPLPPTGARAVAVYCQPGVTANLPNGGRDAPGPDTCSAPRDVTVAEGRVWIADSINNRVLGVPLGRREADVVVGQADKTSRLAQPAAADTLRSPSSVTYDGQNLLVSDSANHRVLVFETPPTEDGASASRVIGQPTLVDGLTGPAQATLSRPSRVAVVPGPFNSARVYVADAGKARVAVFDGLPRIDAE